MELLQVYFRFTLKTRDHTFLISSDIKTHFRYYIKKCALCNKEILHMKLNLNFISDMSINVHSFECYLVQNNCRPVLNKLWQSFYCKKIYILFIY